MADKLSEAGTNAPHAAFRQVLNEELTELERAGRRWTSQEIAAKLDLKAAAVASWRQGRRAPKLSSLRKLAGILRPEDESARERLVGRLVGRGVRDMSRVRASPAPSMR